MPGTCRKRCACSRSRPAWAAWIHWSACPVLTSHAMISAEHRQKMGVTEQLIRLSVGIENADDLIADLEQALTVVAGTRQHALSS